MCLKGGGVFKGQMGVSKFYSVTHSVTHRGVFLVFLSMLLNPLIGSLKQVLTFKVQPTQKLTSAQQKTKNVTQCKTVLNYEYFLKYVQRVNN